MSKTKFEQAVDQAIEKYITTDRVVTSFLESEESGFKAGAAFGSEYERERLETENLELSRKVEVLCEMNDEARANCSREAFAKDALKEQIKKLESENEDLKNTLNGVKNCKAGDFVVYHPVKNPDADNIFETINKLREQVKDYEQALDTIATDNIYVAESGWRDEYFLSVKQAREVLKKWSVM